MDLSIIITSYKNPQLLKVCLDSVMENLSDVSHELIVVDGETKEDTEMMMREDYPAVSFFSNEKNVGFQALLKQGIENSHGEYLLLLNGDIIVKSNAIQDLLSHIKQSKTIGMIGPKLLNFNGTLQYSCFRFYKPWTILYRRTFLGKFQFAKKHLAWFLMEDYNHIHAKEVDWLMGSALLVSKEAIEKVGLMDARFFMYMEDVDWCRRFWEKGFGVVYYPAALMHHYHGKGSAKGGFLRSLLFSKLTWVHIISGIKYFNKYWGKKIPKHN